MQPEHSDAKKRSSLGQRKTRSTMTHSRYALLAWANFALLAAAALKFIPIAISLTHGIQLSSAQVEAGLADERAWAMDLISDTPYLLLVWLSVAWVLRRQTGSAILKPWNNGAESARP